MMFCQCIIDFGLSREGVKRPQTLQWWPMLLDPSKTKRHLDNFTLSPPFIPEHKYFRPPRYTINPTLHHAEGII